MQSLSTLVFAASASLLAVGCGGVDVGSRGAALTSPAAALADALPSCDALLAVAVERPAPNARLAVEEAGSADRVLLYVDGSARCVGAPAGLVAAGLLDTPTSAVVSASGGKASSSDPMPATGTDGKGSSSDPMPATGTDGKASSSDPMPATGTDGNATSSDPMPATGTDGKASSSDPMPATGTDGNATSSDPMPATVGVAMRRGSFAF